MSELDKHLKWQYCGVPCNDCPVTKLDNPQTASMEVDMMFAERGPDLTRGVTTQEQAVAIAREEGSYQPDIIGKAVFRHLDGQCETSPETSTIQ